MRGMLKFFMFLAVCAGLFWARSAIIASGIDSEAKPFVQDVVGKITMPWSKAELEMYADVGALTQQVAAMGNPHALDFAHFSLLGERTSAVECRLGDYTTFKDETRNYTAANYSCAAMFARGEATILLNVIREKDNAPWRIGYFDVISPALSSSITPPERK